MFVDRISIGSPSLSINIFVRFLNVSTQLKNEISLDTPKSHFVDFDHNLRDIPFEDRRDFNYHTADMTHLTQ